MKKISTEELINHKILPYNLFSEFGEKLFSAGEILTPGKLLQLKHINILYRDDEVISFNDSGSAPSSKVSKPNEVVVETFDMSPASITRNKLSVDDMDILNYKGPVNKKAKIDPQTQLKIKAFYNQILSMMEDKPPLEMLGMFANIRDKIVLDILSDANEVFLSSQLKLLGEYNKCHALNTGILSGAVAKRMDLSENVIHEVVLAGLLHDIGKSRIPEEILTKVNLTNQEQKLIQNHTITGYKILKTQMDLPESIARVALEHHENNDGSGFPAGKSGDQIGIQSRIVSVCNYFDALTSNRTTFKVRNTKEALRVMLGMGTKRFSADALYTFVHMFSYNDTTAFEEMIL